MPSVPIPFPQNGRSWRHREPLAGDASTRRYARLCDDRGESLIEVDYADGIRAQMGRDLEVLEWCRGHGLRVPEIVRSQPRQGNVLLEDFGARDAEASLRRASSGERPAMVRRMIGPLEALARVPSVRLPTWNPPLRASRLRWELAGFELWFVRHLRGRAPSQPVGEWLDGLAEAVDRHPKRICHRDYHLNNLFLLPDGDVGVIDVQDILVGPDTYDVVSLLEERAMPELLERDTRDEVYRWWARATRAPGVWRTRCREVRLQRALKVLGTFARLSLAGRLHYRPWLDSTVRALLADRDDLELPGAVIDLLLH
jgi:aminoglycoside/choline kinase family phosphotransferase